MEAGAPDTTTIEGNFIVFGSATFLNNTYVPTAPQGTASTIAASTAFVHANAVWTSVLAFLPAGQPDGVTDNTSGIATAVSTLCGFTAAGGHLYFPRGTYVISGQILSRCGLIVSGDGMGVTTINYSGAGAGLEWQVTGFPAFPSTGHVQGGGLENLTMTRTDASASQAVTVEGFFNWRMENVVFNSPYNLFYSYGNEHINISKIYLNGGVNLDWVFYGDLAGETASGGSCSTSNNDCSTRSDFIVISDVENIDNTLTSTSWTFQGFVATIMMNHVANEGPLYPLSITCQTGLNANMAQCPQFFTFQDFQAEFFHKYPLIEDFLDFKCIQCYFYGDGTSTNANTFVGNCTNYCGSTTPPGIVVIDDSRFFVAYNNNISLNGLYDIKINNSYIWGGNISNTSKSGIVICATGSCPTVHLTGNTFCTVDGYAGANALNYGIVLNSGVKDAVVANNTFRGCSNNYSSSVSGTLASSNNIGP